jgi:hypothetical protein
LPPKKRVVLYLNTKVKVIEASEKDKVTVKGIVAKFKAGKAQTVGHVKSLV